MLSECICYATIRLGCVSNLFYSGNGRMSEVNGMSAGGKRREINVDAG
jgi:hypothetical protein